MVTKSKKIGERLRKAAKQREKERFMKMTPKQRRRFKREIIEKNRRLNETEDQRIDRESREIIAGCLIGVIFLMLVIFLVIWLLNYIVASSSG